MAELSTQNRELIIAGATEIAERAYAPYSRFHVGAALLCDDGTVFRGVNVENRSYGLAICAERSAITTAVTEGYTHFAAIAVYSPDSAYPVSPCGACRQVISEFMDPDGTVIFVGRDGVHETHRVSDILPFDALHELKNRPID
ncbi:MAG: cytidine deaminase [Spirochaetota bacterium]